MFGNCAQIVILKVLEIGWCTALTVDVIGLRAPYFAPTVDVGQARRSPKLMGVRLRPIFVWLRLGPKLPLLKS